MDPNAYEDYLVPVLFAPLAEALLAAAGPVRGLRVLDVACGTGIVARRAAATAAGVTALDKSPAMLEVAARLDPRVRWVPGDAAELPFADHSFDVAFCQQGLQFTPDPAAVVRELHRVVAPGGRLALALWCDISRAPGFAALATVLDRHGAPGDLMRAPFRLPDADRVHLLLTGGGFTAVDRTTRVLMVRFPSVPEFFARQVAASPLAAALAPLDTATRQAMIEDLGEVLAGHLDGEGLLFPAEAHLFTAVAGPSS
ncbi:class I SAM-dependent methyltransferase [Actinoplanes sp. CA-142083]|uniref:class I SAM-dependent methyltransferase n=1 Tax=Actinoplanes sp. CA-142083 TaxID=3239903 RepID=UPI003D8E69B5